MIWFEVELQKKLGPYSRDRDTRVKNRPFNYETNTLKTLT